MVVKMEDTARKIPHDAVILLDELQAHLKRRGIKVTQKELIAMSVKLASRQEGALRSLLRKPKDNSREMTAKFLRHSKKFDFGKNWMEEIDTTS